MTGRGKLQKFNATYEDQVGARECTGLGSELFIDHLRLEACTPDKHPRTTTAQSMSTSIDFLCFCWKHTTSNSFQTVNSPTVQTVRIFRNASSDRGLRTAKNTSVQAGQRWRIWRVAEMGWSSSFVESQVPLPCTPGNNQPFYREGNQQFVMGNEESESIRCLW